jgi:hypothetical protein
MTRMAVLTPSAGADCLTECMESWNYQPTYVLPGTNGVLPALEAGLRTYDNEILAYFHDDLLICEPNWHERVLVEFDDPTVGLVGFGGALQHGSADLYRTPYKLQQLGRTDYVSNVEDAEVHGARYEGSCDVAVLDGFVLIVRRSILERAGGWPVNTSIGYVNYDYWLSCITRRFGYRIRMAGVRCLHMGGRTAVLLKMDQNTPEHHAEAHQFIYREFADVLPCRV